MSLLGQLMKEARKAELSHGVHENCFITAVSNEKRETKDGKIINRGGYTTFVAKNAEGRVVSEKEIAWFDLDPTSEHVYTYWYSQFEQMSAIVDIYQGTVKDRWVEGLAEIFADAGAELDWEDDSAANVAAFEQQIKALLCKKASCSTLVKGMNELYVKLLEKKIGEDSDPVRVKLVFDSQGKNIQQPRFGLFVESMTVPNEDSVLKLTKTDDENRQKSLTGNVAKPAATPENLGNL